MTASNEFLPLSGEAIPTSHIRTTPEVPPRPDSLVYADGAIYASKDPSDVEGHQNQDALLRVEDKNLYGVFGGVEGGDGAACAASKAIENYYSSKPTPKSTREAYVHMSDALFAAREAVYSDGPEKKTTGTIIQAHEDEASGKSFVTIGHVGDTRAYVLRAKDGRLEQLTEDQGSFFDEGPTRGADDGGRYSLSNAIGGQDPRGRNRPGRMDQIFSRLVEKGDRILICTNGITGSNVLTSDEVAAAVATGTPRDAAINTAILALSKDGQREADDKSAFVLEIGSTTETGAAPSAPETNVKSHVRTAPHLGQVGTSTTVIKHAVLPPPRPTLHPNVPQPERRVVKGFPDSQGGKVSYIANTLDGVLGHINRPGGEGQLIGNLIDAARTEESQIGYAATGTALRSDIVARATQLVAAHDRQLQVGGPYNHTLYQLGTTLRSFKNLNKDLVNSTDWEKATSSYRERGGDALEKHQIEMFDKFLDQIEALDADPSLKTDPKMQAQVQEITQLVTDFTDALKANAPWDGVKATGGPRGDLVSQRMLAIMNSNKGVMLQGNKGNVTLTTDQMGLVTYLAARFKQVSDPGPKRRPNKDYIHVPGPGRARQMLAGELLDLEGIREVLGQSIDPTTTRIGPYAAQHDIGGFRPQRNRREFRERVYQEEVLPRARLLGMDRNTLIALLKDDAGTQSLMDLISNAANGPLKKKILVQRPPTP